MGVGEAPIVTAHVVDEAGRVQEIKCLVDTGNTCGLVVTRRVADDLGLSLRNTSQAQLNTNSGMIPALTGNVASLAIGELNRPTNIEVIEQGPSAIVGQEWLRETAGLIFDWPKNRLGLIPFDVELPVNEGWVELPLIKVSFEAPGAEVPNTLRVNRLLIQTLLDGRKEICHLDTGFPGDLSTNGRVVPLGRTRAIHVGSFGRRYRAAIGSAPGVLEVGSLRFSPLSLLILPPRHNAIDLHSFTAGLGVLTRYPMWVDYNRAVVRFWVGEGAVDLSNPRLPH